MATKTSRGIQKAAAVHGALLCKRRGRMAGRSCLSPMQLRASGNLLETVFRFLGGVPGNVSQERKCVSDRKGGVRTVGYTPEAANGGPCARKRMVAGPLRPSEHPRIRLPQRPHRVARRGAAWACRAVPRRQPCRDNNRSSGTRRFVVSGARAVGSVSARACVSCSNWPAQGQRRGRVDSPAPATRAGRALMERSRQRRC